MPHTLQLIVQTMKWQTVILTNEKQMMTGVLFYSWLIDSLHTHTITSSWFWTIYHDTMVRSMAVKYTGVYRRDHVLCVCCWHVDCLMYGSDMLVFPDDVTLYHLNVPEWNFDNGNLMYSVVSWYHDFNDQPNWGPTAMRAQQVVKQQVVKGFFVSIVTSGVYSVQSVGRIWSCLLVHHVYRVTMSVQYVDAV